ncbi:unnamed protein product [Brachionus calyciflorus]|uniref:Uncharacterized protein n=1 Tax=Brachionus calyciflorus TaxID=104777 RepID=A0A813ZH77_9BILA|nr:unnamed protein product [Brachionus calyciflorus]
MQEKNFFTPRPLRRPSSTFDGLTGKRTWRCIVNNCRGSCYTYTEVVGENCDVCILNEQHVENDDDSIKLKTLEHRRKIKEKAMLSDEAPGKIILEFEHELDDEEAIALSGSYESLRQVIHRAKNKNKPDYPKESEDLKSLSFPEFLTQINNSETFLFFDSGPEDPERFIIFTTKKNLKLIENNHIRLIDGQCLPLVYCLLPNKSQKLYERLLSKVNEELQNPPLSITSDFEKAFTNAVKRVFKNVPVYGCFFHFKQNLFRKIQALGLTQAYKENEELRIELKIPQGLAYLPEEDVISTFEKLKTRTSKYPELTKFYEYIETTYIGELTKSRGRYPKLIRKDPLFECGFLNVNKRISQNIPKTNNFVEAWHNSFSSMLVSHPLVYAIVDTFKREQTLTQNKIKTGIMPKKKPSYTVLDDRIRLMLKSYTVEDWEEVTSGVPQGSVLGPLLFVVYINDILDLIKSPFLSYADDLKMIGVLGKDELVSNKLQNDLNELFNWSKKWSTKLNLLKCKTMYIGNTVKTMYAVGNINLKETIEEKDLGVFVTNDLKWNRQCSVAAA